MDTDTFAFSQDNPVGSASNNSFHNPFALIRISMISLRTDLLIILVATTIGLTAQQVKPQGYGAGFGFSGPSLAAGHGFDVDSNLNLNSGIGIQFDGVPKVFTGAYSPIRHFQEAPGQAAAYASRSHVRAVPYQQVPEPAASYPSHVGARSFLNKHGVPRAFNVANLIQAGNRYVKTAPHSKKH